jgi:hypothetical protein
VSRRCLELRKIAGAQLENTYVCWKIFMKQSCVLLVLTLALALGSPVSAQMPNPGQAAGLNAAMTKLFGDVTAFSSKATVRLLDKNQKETMLMPLAFALLDGKIRADIDLTQIKSKEIQAEAMAMFKQMGMDKMTTIIRPDHKATIVVYPSMKSYAEVPMSKEDAASADKNYKVAATKIGTETIDGHPCEKQKVVVTDEKGEKHEALVWKATDLKNFPVQMQIQQGDGAVLMNYRDVVTARPDANLFEAPAGFTKHPSVEKMMEGAMMKMMGK